jgi:hypothetical protein
MDNAVSINSKKILGAYIDAQSGDLIPEDAYFCAGVFLSMLLPEFAFVTYGGLVPLVTFAACAVAGSVYGLARYRSANRHLPCVVVGTEARVPPRKDVSRKRA